MERMLKLHPMALQYASKELRMDEDLVLEALKRNFRCLQHAPELCASRRFMLRAVQVDAFALSLAHEEVRKDPEIACEAVEREPLCESSSGIFHGFSWVFSWFSFNFPLILAGFVPFWSRFRPCSRPFWP